MTVILNLFQAPQISENGKEGSRSGRARLSATYEL